VCWVGRLISSVGVDICGAGFTWKLFDVNTVFCFILGFQNGLTHFWFLKCLLITEFIIITNT